MDRFVKFVIVNRRKIKVAFLIEFALYAASLLLKGRITTMYAFLISVIIYNIVFFTGLALVFSWLYQKFKK